MSDKEDYGGQGGIDQSSIDNSHIDSLYEKINALEGEIKELKLKFEVAGNDAIVSRNKREALISKYDALVAAGNNLVEKKWSDTAHSYLDGNILISVEDYNKFYDALAECEAAKEASDE